MHAAQVTAALLRLLRKLTAAVEETDSGPVTLALSGRFVFFLLSPSSLDSFQFSELSKEIQEPSSVLYKHGLAHNGCDGMLSHGATTDRAMTDDE